MNISLELERRSVLEYPIKSKEQLDVLLEDLDYKHIIEMPYYKIDRMLTKHARELFEGFEEEFYISVDRKSFCCPPHSIVEAIEYAKEELNKKLEDTETLKMFDDEGKIIIY